MDEPSPLMGFRDRLLGKQAQAGPPNLDAYGSQVSDLEAYMVQTLAPLGEMTRERAITPR